VLLMEHLSAIPISRAIALAVCQTRYDSLSSQHAEARIGRIERQACVVAKLIGVVNAYIEKRH
jgi:hypothetical protein